MAMAMDKEAVFEAVRAVLANSLAAEAGKIRSDSTLIGELGVDSLDFLDILFALEKKFAVKLRNSDLDRLLRADFSTGKLVDREFLPREEIDRLSEWVPGLKAAPDRDRITPYSLFSFLTVESLVLLIGKKVEGDGPAGMGGVPGSGPGPSERR